jgi:predicted ester cyclase
MSVEANKEVVRKLYEIANSGDLAGLTQVAGTELAATLTRGIQRVRNGFSDARWELHDLTAEADRVVARWSRTGTHTGSYRGVEASGKRVVFSGFRMFRMEDGKAVETIHAEDTFGMLKQMGAIEESVGVLS